MAPLLTSSGLRLGGQQVSAVRRGTVQVWASVPAVQLPAIGEAFQGGFYAGLISHSADGVATHALIVAPVATGASGSGYSVFTNYAWSPSSINVPGAASTFDGKANTDAMAAVGINSFPAAKFCRERNIGGYTDWYLPARFELEIAYYNLKYSTSSNNTSLGANPYSVPRRNSNYSASVPGITSVLAFRSGGAQAWSAFQPWVSNQVDAGNANVHNPDSGAFTTDGKWRERCVRAFRKVAL